MFDKIMESIESQISEKQSLASSVLYDISRYEKDLKPLYEKNLLDIYERIAVAMARPASGRAGYRELVKVLRQMLSYEGGEACVRNLINEWRITYNNRPAMQDELRDALR